MGIHRYLDVECKLKKEFINVIQNKTYFENDDMSFSFSIYTVNNDIFKFQIWKSGMFNEDIFIDFVKKLIVPITTNISYCSTYIDDFGCKQNNYSDDKLRRAHFITIYSIPPKNEIQYGKRVEVKAIKPEIINKLHIYPNIYESDKDTWPPELRNWWDSIDKNTVINLIKYYPEDEELMNMANWLSNYVDRNDVKISYTYE